VLLVDDQRFVGVAVGRILGVEPDIELHCCDDASRALAIATKIRPTLILQDLVMPGMDGISLIESFRRDPLIASTPIVALSGNDDASSRARALAAGANDYVLKLPSKDDLIACIRHHASGASMSGQTSAPRVESDMTLDRRVLETFEQAGLPDTGDFVSGLIEQFLRDATAQVDSLDDFARRLDAPALKRVAHSLKGSAMTMGANRLAALCSQLEGHLDTRPGEAMTPLIAAIGEELGRVHEAFSSVYPDAGPPASSRR
jgi:PleD family two-component response regulator